MIDTPPAEGPGRRAALAQRYRAWRAQGLNPVLLKELRGRFRGGRAFRVLTTFLILLASLAFVVVSFSSAQFFAQTTGMTGMRGANGRAVTGQSLYGLVVLVEGFFIAIVAPALTMNAVSGERERQTLELLLATPLTGFSILLGKVGAAMAFLGLVVFSALPVVSLAFLYGGVSLPEMLADQIAILCAGLLFASLGAFYSSVAAKTGRALLLTFATLGGLMVLRWMMAIFIAGISLVGAFSGFGSPASTMAPEQVLVMESMRYLNGLPTLTGRAAGVFVRGFGITSPWMDMLSTLMSGVYWILLALILITVSGARLRGASKRVLRRINLLVIAVWVWNVLAALVDVPIRQAMVSSWGASMGQGMSATGLSTVTPGGMSDLLVAYLAAGLGAALPIFPLLIWLIARGFLPPVRSEAR